MKNFDWITGGVVAGVALLAVVALGVPYFAGNDTFGALRTFNSAQLGAGATNGYILQTNGATSTWVVNSAGATYLATSTPWTAGEIVEVTDNGNVQSTSSISSNLIEDAFLVNNADDTTTGRLTVAGLTTSAPVYASSTLHINANGSDLVARLFENTGGEYFDLNVLSDGSLRFQSDDGSPRMTISDEFEIVRFENELEHLGDADTSIKFLTDQIQIEAGGVTFLDIVEAATDIVTALGEWDFGGATSFEIVNGTDITLNAAGEMGVLTGTSSLRFHDGTAERQLKDEWSFGATFASSSLAFDGEFDAAGTTTVLRSGFKYGVTITEVYCRTNAGTADLMIGDGSASTSALTCTTSGATDSSPSNASFPARELIRIGLGNAGNSALTDIYFDATVRWTID